MPAPARASFGSLPDGTAVSRWTLTDTTGTSASILDYGAIIQALRVPDRTGRTANVVLGFDDLPDYVERSPYFGALIGRYGNRIASGKFELEGGAYQLDLNDGGRPNSLHGGANGFDRRMWDAVAEEVEGGSAVTLTRVSPDGEEGFPGALTVSVRYTLAHGRFTLDYRAETDATTVVNLTNHAHFNLAGADSGTSILDHELSVAAQEFLPVDRSLIPLESPIPVAGTAFDFRAPRAIGARLDDPHPQLVLTDGYDHCFVLAGGPTAEPRNVASLKDPRSGRTMRVETTEPGVQVYICSHFDGTLVGAGGVAYPKYGGVALETQHYPDSPNRPEYPSTALGPGDVYRSTTVLDFGLSGSAG
ncbi:aldose epimerase family protein [Actinospica sp.]|uniref:aldose epimerase family protein n=1 Tax=Actinospica sp. TaxID=1872142 RepID=UPI002C952EBF|nr:aldose epimerase family protein [Actinospica sp.]HWG23983.1 aldose epimerase family protein [Actinospica sp.]